MTSLINYRRILLSAVVIAFVTSLVFAGTSAFFNDTESSTGNTFTAGEIDLKIDSEQHYNGMVCQLTDEGYIWVFPGGRANNVFEPGTEPFRWGETCTGTWDLTDLEDGVHKFFNFDDVKPGDEGENTISIHIDTNPAWMCADIVVTSNDDVDCTEPEDAADAENGACQNSSPSEFFDGELAQNLNFFSWLDDGSIDGFQNDDSDPEEGDNIWQDGENPLFSNGVGPLSDAIDGVTYALADATTPFGPLPPGLVQYIGLQWCAGALTIDGPGQLTCDGGPMGNDAQTDQTVVDLTFRVEQSRNNDSFVCEVPDVQPII